jgi:hypothetical protein
METAKDADTQDKSGNEDVIEFLGHREELWRQSNPDFPGTLDRSQ